MQKQLLIRVDCILWALLSLKNPGSENPPEKPSKLRLNTSQRKS
jgi:hypothetical protein